MGSPGRFWALLGAPLRSWPRLGSPGRFWALLNAPERCWALLVAPRRHCCSAADLLITADFRDCSELALRFDQIYFRDRLKRSFQVIQVLRVGFMI